MKVDIDFGVRSFDKGRTYRPYFEMYLKIDDPEIAVTVELTQKEMLVIKKKIDEAIGHKWLVMPIRSKNK